MSENLNLTKIMKDFEKFAQETFIGFRAETVVEYVFDESHLRLGLRIQMPNSNKSAFKHYSISILLLENAWDPNEILRTEAKRLVKMTKTFLDGGTLFERDEDE